MKKKQKLFNFQQLLPQAKNLGEIFIEQTKIVKQDKSFLSKKVPDSWIKVGFKAYSRLPAVKLPKVKLSTSKSFEQTLKERSSSREFAKTKLKLSQLAACLHYAAGINRKNKLWLMNRFYPSGGSRYPLETYILVFNVEGLKPGIYHFYVKDELLEYLGSVNKKLVACLFLQTWVKKASAVIVLSAVFARSTVKYGNRGYRFVFLEAGHLAQSLYLIAANLNLSCCAIGGYLDHKLDELLQLDGVKESAIYALALGNKP